MFSSYFKKVCVLINIIRETQIPRRTPRLKGANKPPRISRISRAGRLISLPLPAAPQPSALLLPPINNLPAFASGDAYQKGQLSELAGHDSEVIRGSPAMGQPTRSLPAGPGAQGWESAPPPGEGEE